MAVHAYAGCKHDSARALPAHATPEHPHPMRAPCLALGTCPHPHPPPPRAVRGQAHRQLAHWGPACWRQHTLVASTLPHRAQCEDKHIASVPQGSLWSLPCGLHHAHHKRDWHWKPSTKRSWKGDACLCE